VVVVVVVVDGKFFISSSQLDVPLKKLKEIFPVQISK